MTKWSENFVLLVCLCNISLNVDHCLLARVFLCIFKTAIVINYDDFASFIEVFIFLL